MSFRAFIEFVQKSCIAWIDNIADRFTILRVVDKLIMSEPNMSTIGIEAKKLTVKEVVSADILSDLKLSADASQVVYCVRQHYKSSVQFLHYGQQKHLSTVAQERSLQEARTTTLPVSTLSHQTSIFSLTATRRADMHIYSLTIDASVYLEPQAVLPLDNSEAVSFFSISPDGNYLAFISKSQSQGPGAKEGISIWRDKKDLGRLCVANLQDREKQLVELSLFFYAHVDTFSWSHDSTRGEG